MSFEKDYPSFFNNQNDWSIRNDNFRKEQIMECCKDNQKIRDAIKKIRESVDENTGPYYADEVLDSILKELNL